MTNYSVRLEITTGNTEQRLQTLRRELAKVEQSGLKMTNSLNGAVISQSVKMLTDTITKMGRGSSSASSDVEKLQKQLLQAQTKSENLAKSLDRANIRLARLGQAFEKSKAMGTKFANEIKQANAKIDEMSKKMQKTEQEVQKAKRAFGGLGDLKGKLQSLAGFTIFGMGVADVLKTADTMKTLDTQIKLVTKSEQEHAAVKANLYNISNKTRQDITSTIEAYTNNARSLGQLGKNQAEVLKFTENISLAMAVGGKSAQEQSAALLQLGQAMQSGVLQGDEFRSIAENSPILLDLIAEKLGKTRGEVKKLASDGKITSEVIYQSVIGAGDELNKKFATMPATMSQALTVVQNRYTQAVDDFFNKSGGLGEQIAKSLLWVSDNFGTLTNTVMGLGVVYGGYMALNSKFVSTTIPTKIAALAASTRAFHAESVAINANTAAKIRNDGVIKTLTASLKATRIGRFTSSLAGATAELGKGTARMVGYANEARKTHGTLGALRLGVVNTTTAIFNKNRAIGVLNATKGLLIGTAGRLGGVMTTLGRAILGVGAIIKAHPIMFIAGIITTVITATMGLENAMKSFGDAVGIVGLMVKDFVKWSVDGIGKQITKAIDFMAGFFGSKSKDGTNQASNAFKDFFKTSQGGFVGLLEITAKIFDQIVTMAKASMLYASSYVGDMVISVKNAYNAMMPSWMGGGGEQQATRNMSFSDAIFQSQSFTLQNMVGNAQTILRADEYNRNQALQHDLGQVGTGGLNKLGEETKKAKDKDAKATKDALTSELQRLRRELFVGKLKLQHNPFAELTADIAFGKYGKHDTAQLLLLAEQNDRMQKAVEFSERLQKVRQEIAEIGLDEIGLLELQRSNYAMINDENFNRLKTLIEEKNAKQNTHNLTRKIAELDEKILLVGKSELEVLQHQLNTAKEYEGVSDDIKQSYLDRTKALQDGLEAAERLAKVKSATDDIVKHKHILSNWQDKHAALVYDLTKDGYNANQIDKIVGAAKAKEQVSELTKLFDDLKHKKVFGDAINTANITSFGGGIDFVTQLYQKQAELDKVLNNEQAKLKNSHEQGLLDLKTYQQQDLALREQYEAKKRQLSESSNQALFGGATSLMKMMYGENHKYHKWAFALEKTYAVSRILLQNKVALANAWASAPFPANLGAVAKTLAQTGALASAVNAIKPIGQAHDGIMSVPKSGTWNLEKGERVLPKHTAKALDDKLASMGNGKAVNVIIHNHSNAQATVEEQPNGDIMVTIGKAARYIAKDEIQKYHQSQLRQGGIYYGR